MANQSLRIKDFRGGLSDDDEFGQPASFSEGQNIDFRRSPGYITLTRKLVKQSSTIVTQPVFDAVRVASSNVYFAAGNLLYKRAFGADGAGIVFTNPGGFTNMLNGFDLDYRPEFDRIFVYMTSTIGEYDPTNALWTPGAYPDYDMYNQDATGGAYTLPTAITEADLQTFVCTGEPIATVYIRSVAKSGTAHNLVITIHDSANNVVATKTVASGSYSAGTEVPFAISAAQSRFIVGNTYHVHVVCSAGVNTILSTAANTLQLADLRITANRLVDTSGDRPYVGHRLIKSGAKTYFCNERYLGEWEILSRVSTATDGFLPHKIKFPSEVKTNGVTLWNDYLLVSASIDDHVDTVGKPNRGIIFGWNMADTFYNFSVPVPQGVPNSLFSHGGAAYFEASGRWYTWNGGAVEPIFEFPGVNDYSKVTSGYTIETDAGAARIAMATIDDLLMIGYPFSTGNLNVKIGLYSYGKRKSFMPIAVGYDGVLSTGHDQTQNFAAAGLSRPGVGITLLKKFGNTLMIGWQDIIGTTPTYGVDFIDESSIAAPTGSWASLWFDNGAPDKEKTAVAIKIVFNTLATGVTVTPKIRYDRAATYTKVGVTTDEVGAVGDTECVMELNDRFYEAMFGFDITSTGAFPKIRSITFKFDDNSEEEVDTEAIRRP